MNLPLTLTLKKEDLITKDVVKSRDNLAARGKEISGVTNSEQNVSAGEVVREIRKYVKDVTAARKSLTKPLDDAASLLIQIEREHLAPLVEEQARLERAGTAWLELENKRIAAEEKKRQEEFEAAQKEQFRLADEARKAATPVQQMIANRKLESAKSNVMEIIAAPVPELEKARGQSMKQVLKWEVTDLMLLVKHNPQLCKIEPSPAAIKSTCAPGVPIPGLRCWYENQATYTTR